MSEQEGSAQLAVHVLHAVGTRTPLLLGCDREMLLCSGLLAFALAFAGMSTPYFLMSGVIWFVCLNGLRQMGKADPRMRYKIVRHLVLVKQQVYRARATPFAKSRMYH